MTRRPGCTRTSSSSGPSSGSPAASPTSRGMKKPARVALADSRRPHQWRRTSPRTLPVSGRAMFWVPMRATASWTSSVLDAQRRSTVALPTPARAATPSIVSAARPRSARSSSVASRIAAWARALRGRPGGLRLRAGLRRQRRPPLAAAGGWKHLGVRWIGLPRREEPERDRRAQQGDTRRQRRRSCACRRRTPTAPPRRARASRPATARRRAARLRPCRSRSRLRAPAGSRSRCRPRSGSRSPGRCRARRRRARRQALRWRRLHRRADARLGRGSEPITESVAGAIVGPCPTPSSDLRRSGRSSSAASRMPNSRAPVATTVRPTATTLRADACVTGRDSGATITPTRRGTIRTPASNGE